MKILVVCQYYYPEPFRIHEVCEELVARGHEVTVLTGLPNYPMGIIPDEYKAGKHRDETVNGVHILRVKETPRTQGKVGLAKNYISYVWHGCIKALTMKKDYDVIFVYQLSPILMAIPAYVAKWFSRTKHIALYCLDLWPESLVSLGIGKNGVFFRFMKWVSRRIYKGAYNIAYTSEMFAEYFKEELRVVKDNFAYIPQFADELFSEIDSEKPQDGSSAKQTVDYVFAGNVGKMQSVDTIMRAAALVDNPDIRWHIVGDGFALEECQKLSEELKVGDKVIFHGRQPVEKMPEYYCMADAMLVTLSDNETISYTLPGKIQSYMAAGKPILAAADGETANVIAKADCGICVKACDAQELAKAAEQMADMDLHRFGCNSKDYYDNNFSKEAHIDAIEGLLKACL